MTLLHVEKLDGENIGGTLHFLACQHQRLMMLLFRPPLDRRRNRGERGERTLTQDAKEVDIGEVWVKFPVRSGTVKDHAQEIRSRCRTQPADEFVNLFFRYHSAPSCCNLP